MALTCYRTSRFLSMSERYLLLGRRTRYHFTTGGRRIFNTSLERSNGIYHTLSHQIRPLLLSGKKVAILIVQEKGVGGGWLKTQDARPTVLGANRQLNPCKGTLTDLFLTTD
ncbi:MAG: hypothetical protein IPK68_04785 [Bdellovibrionales bacterium]|nr:hypothetical protein [Bdellovibrionales bacterium]